MNKFGISMVSLVAMSGLAFAQAGAGAKVDVKAGATAPAAGAKVDAKAGAAAGAPATPAKVEMPKPPAEIAAAAKAMARMTCKGTGMSPADMQMADVTGTATAKTDLDGWWIRQDLTMKVGKGKAMTTMKMTRFMTYDAKAAKWKVIDLDNSGGTDVGSADMKDGKFEMQADMTSPMGAGMFKDHGDMSDKKNIKMWGEMSMDKGKTWNKVYEVTCK